MENLLQLLNNKDLFVKFFPLLNKDLFETAADRVLFTIVDEIYTTYKTVPKLSEINQLSDTEIKPVVEQWSEAFLEDETKHFIENNTMRLAMENSIEMLDDNNYSGIVKTMQDATNIDFGETLGTSIYDLVDIYAEMMTTKKLLPTGWKTLDEKLGGGVQIPSLNYFVAKSGFGKSITLVNLAANIVKQGRDVLYITLELSDMEVLKRYIQRSTATSTKDFDLKLLLEKVKSSVLNGDGEFTSLFKQPGTLSSLELENIVEKYIATHDGKVPIIMVDYGGLMKPNNFYPQMPSFEKDKYISEELRGVATKFNTVVWNVEQFNRTASGENDEPSEENLQGGISKVQTCDNMIAMIPNNKSRELGFIRCKVFKARNAPCAGQYFDWKVHWETLWFEDAGELKPLKTPSDTTKDMNKLEKIKSNNPAANVGKKISKKIYKRI